MSFLAEQEADFLQLWGDVGEELADVGGDKKIPALVSARAAQDLMADGGFDERFGYGVTVLTSRLTADLKSGTPVSVRGKDLQVNRFTPRRATVLLDCVDLNT